MKTNKRQVWKSISLLVFAFATSLFLFTNCSSDDEDFTEPQLTIVNEGEIEFEKDAGSKSIEIKSNRDWKVTKEADADWIDVSPSSGLEGTATLNITVKSNDGIAREGSFTITASTAKKTVYVKQKGKDGSVIVYSTIAEIRTMYADKGQAEWTIAEPLKLKGVVISDRAGGNSPSLRNGFLQDESGKGLAFRVTESIHEFDMGDEINLNLEGAVVSEYAGAIQLGFSTSAAKVQAQNVAVTPKELTIEEVLDGNYDATLVKIKDVQFKTYEGLSYFEGEENATNRTLENCNNANIIARTTKYAKFKDEKLRKGKGDVIGIMSVFNGTWQLAIRNLEDVKGMSDDASTRCTPDVPPITGTKISIADFRAALVDGEVFTGDNYLEGEIILNPSEMNTPTFIAYIADGTAGVALTFTDSENIVANVPLGAKVKVNVKDTKAKVFNGLWQVGDGSTLTTQSVEIVEKIATSPLAPKVVTMDDILAGKYQSELVKIENVQFKDASLKYTDNKPVINEANQELQIYTRQDATFAGETVMQGMGPIVAVVSIHNTPQLLIRSVADLAGMTGDRFIVSFINTDVNAVTFEIAGGTETINVTANVDWTASSDETWVTIAPASGSNDGAITLTATANDGAERKANITITDGTVVKTVLVVQKGEAPAGGVATDLFFSEYIEGGANNKYLEIYNGTGTTVDLSDYKVELYSNGKTEIQATEMLTGTLENGKVIVLKNANATIYEGDALVSETVNFNGDDAIVLIRISTDSYIDVIGRVGEQVKWKDPTNSELSTVDRTLVRKPSIRGGVTTNPAEGFPTLSTEWISYPKDTIDYLGSHTMN